jgi:hypothetical protein
MYRTDLSHLYPFNLVVWSRATHPELFAIATVAPRPVEKENLEVRPILPVHPLISLISPKMDVQLYG